jgi:hypothetical protein
MARYDDTCVDRFLEPWNRHNVDGALALMTDDCAYPQAGLKQAVVFPLSTDGEARSAILRTIELLS